jgi:hypothetical protein
MPGFLRRFFLSDFGPPPRPDVAQQRAFRGQRLIETIYSDSKRERAFITVDEAGLYRIIVERWDTSDWKEWQQAFWRGCAIGSYTDTFERARDLAKEALRC